MVCKISKKAKANSELDIDAMLRVANQMADLLDADIEEPFEWYLVARLISILYEEEWNFSLDSKFEAEVRNRPIRAKRMAGD